MEVFVKYTNNVVDTFFDYPIYTKLIIWEIIWCWLISLWFMRDHLCKKETAMDPISNLVGHRASLVPTQMIIYCSLSFITVLWYLLFR
jgi:hypothetical protein